MPENAAPEFDHDEIGLTDLDLVSLYLRYPDMQQSDHDSQDDVSAQTPLAPIPNSSPESSPQSTQLYSSPLPNPTGYESPTSSPLGPSDIIPFPALAIATNEQEVEDLTTLFDLTLRSYDVPKETAELLAEMKSMMVMMGSILFSVAGEVSTDLETIWRVKSDANRLTLSLKKARCIVEEEIDAAESILQLAPFTVQPGLEDLWTNYKQMAELIIQHTTIPSPRVLDLCEQLCHIYDACVYRPMLAATDIEGNGEALLDYLNRLYNAIMVLLTKYKQWTAAMKRIGDDFTRPTMRRILRSPEVMKGILKFEGQTDAATKTALQMEPATKKVFTSVNEKNRRRHQHISNQESLVLHRAYASLS